MKTICFIVKGFPKITETFVINQILQAKANGFKVSVLTYDLRSIENTSQLELLQQNNILNHTQRIDYKIPASKFKRVCKSFLYIIKHFKYWLRVKGKPWKEYVFTTPFQLAFYSEYASENIFHVQFAMSGLELAEMKAIGLISGQIIVTLHGHDAHYQNQEEQIALKKSYSNLFKQSKQITVNTPYLKERVLSLGCPIDKLQIIPMGIDVSYFCDKEEKILPKQTAIRLISIGRLIELKGYQFAIQALKILVDKGVNVVYTIVGDGEMVTDLHRLIAKFDVEDKVFLVGKKNQAEIKELLKEHQLFLMCSITDATGRAEAQGIVTAEAQAMGLPVVAFNSGGIPDTIQDGKTGVLVPEKDVVAYSEAMMQIIQNPESYINMSKAAREFVVLEFSITRMGQRFLKLYNSCDP